MSDKEAYYHLCDEHTDPKRLRAERDKARKLRASQWWRTLIAKGRCHYCEREVGAKNLTMDHVVPLARGGSSTKGNLVPACHDCNQKKRLGTPAEALLERLDESSNPKK